MGRVTCSVGTAVSRAPADDLSSSVGLVTELNEEEGDGTADQVVISSGNTYCTCSDSRKRRAAVLVCLFEGQDGELRVLLTKRSMKLSSYPGDIALPGGKMDENDLDDTATALREAMEEIGLDPALVQVAATLEPFFSQNLLRVVPVVGLLARRDEFVPVLNVDEVESLFDVPLEMFLKEENHRYEEREWMAWKYKLHVFDYQRADGEEEMTMKIYGLTAGILIRVASIVFQRSPSFDLQGPDFQDLQQLLKLA